MQCRLILSPVRWFMLHFTLCKSSRHHIITLMKGNCNNFFLLSLPFSCSPPPSFMLPLNPPPPSSPFAHYVLCPISVLNQLLILPVIHSLDRGSAGCKTCTYTRQNNLRGNVDKCLCSECISKPHCQCSSCPRRYVPYTLKPV